MSVELNFNSPNLEGIPSFQRERRGSLGGRSISELSQVGALIPFDIALRMPTPVEEMTPFNGPLYANTPSVINIFYAPGDFFSSLYAWMSASSKKDNEGVMDASVRISSVPLSIAHSILGLITLLPEISPYMFYFLASFLMVIALPIFIIGMTICAIETIYESFGITRQVYLMLQQHLGLIKSIPDLCETTPELSKIVNHLEEHLEDLHQVMDEERCENQMTSLKRILRESNTETLSSDDSAIASALVRNFKNALIIHDLDFIDTEYLSVGIQEIQKIKEYVLSKFPTLTTLEKHEKVKEMIEFRITVKKTCLSRRISPGFAKEIEELIPNLMNRLQNGNREMRREASDEALHVFQEIRTECYKKLLIHLIGIAALITSIVGMAVYTLVTPAFAVTGIFAVVGTTLAMLRYFLAKGLLVTKGWRFSWEAITPAPIQKVIDKYFPKVPSSGLAELIE